MCSPWCTRYTASIMPWIPPSSRSATSNAVNTTPASSEPPHAQPVGKRPPRHVYHSCAFASEATTSTLSVAASFWPTYTPRFSLATLDGGSAGSRKNFAGSAHAYHTSIQIRVRRRPSSASAAPVSRPPAEERERPRAVAPHW